MPRQASASTAFGISCRWKLSAIKCASPANSGGELGACARSSAWFASTRLSSEDDGLSFCAERHKIESCPPPLAAMLAVNRSEEHTSELQSRVELVCRL